MLKCIIADEDIQSRKTVESVINQINHITLLKSCSTYHELQKALLDEKVDFIFLDLHFPGFHKTEFINWFKHDPPTIIGMASDRESASDAFDINVADFILKPFPMNQVLKAISKILQSDRIRISELMKKSDVVFVRVHSHFEKIDLHDIVFVEALADYVNIYTSLNKKRYTTHSTMKGIAAKLPQEHFLRIHKSYIVNLDSILEIRKENVLLLDGRTIPVSQSHRNELLEYVF